MANESFDPFTEVAKQLINEAFDGYRTPLVRLFLSDVSYTQLAEAALLCEEYSKEEFGKQRRQYDAGKKRSPRSLISKLTDKLKGFFTFGGGGSVKVKAEREAALSDLSQRLENVMKKYVKTTIVDLDKKIKDTLAAKPIKCKDAANFPNNSSGSASGKMSANDVFRAGLGTVYDIYNTLDKKLKDPSNVPGSPDYLPPIAANEIVSGLRRLLQKYDKDLKRIYTKFESHGRDDLPFLFEEDEPRRTSSDFTRVLGSGEEGAETRSTKINKSNLGPGILAAVGAAGLVPKLLTKIPSFVNYVNSLNDKTAVSNFTSPFTMMSNSNNPQGVSIAFATLAGEPSFGPNTTFAAMREALVSQGVVDPNGTFKSGAEALVRANPAFDRNVWKATWAAGTAHPNLVLSQLWPVSGMPAKVVQKALMSAGVRALKGIGRQDGPLTVITKQTAEAICGSTTSVITNAATATSPIAATLLGIGLNPIVTAIAGTALVAGVGWKLLRAKGLRSSRAAQIQYVLGLMKDFPSQEETHGMVSMPAVADAGTAAEEPEQPATASPEAVEQTQGEPTMPAEQQATGEEPTTNVGSTVQEPDNKKLVEDVVQKAKDFLSAPDNIKSLQTILGRQREFGADAIEKITKQLEPVASALASKGKLTRSGAGNKKFKDFEDFKNYCSELELSDNKFFSYVAAKIFEISKSIKESHTRGSLMTLLEVNRKRDTPPDTSRWQRLAGIIK